MPSDDVDAMLAALKKAAAALRDTDIPFALAGGFATWARGGPASDHDVDLVILPEDAERALDALTRAGMRAEDPPEEWLVKAWDGDVLVDLIFEPTGLPITREVLDRAEELEVQAMRMPVLPLEDVLVTKLNALSEHALEYEGLLETSRALREQVDWGEVRQRTQGSPFARAFFTMADGLGIVPAGS